LNRTGDERPESGTIALGASGAAPRGQRALRSIISDDLIGCRTLARMPRMSPRASLTLSPPERGWVLCCRRCAPATVNHGLERKEIYYFSKFMPGYSRSSACSVPNGDGAWALRLRRGRRAASTADFRASGGFAGADPMLWAYLRTPRFGEMYDAAIIWPCSPLSAGRRPVHGRYCGHMQPITRDRASGRAGVLRGDCGE